MRRPVAGPPRGRLGRCNRYPARGVSSPSYIRCNRFVAPEDGEKSRAETVALRYHSKSRIKAHSLVVLCMFCTRGSAPSRLPLLSLFPARRPASCAFLPVRLRVRALLFARPALHARKRINPNREFITSMRASEKRVKTECKAFSARAMTASTRRVVKLWIRPVQKSEGL